LLKVRSNSAGKSTILSFGGAYSNHLHALAFAGKKLKLKTIGVVRGEKPKILSSTLQDCVAWGMTLQWLNRRDYRNIAPVDCVVDYSKKYPDAWIIPEGGSSEQGVLGVRELFERMWSAGDMNYDVIACPVGSGATLAGIISANLGEVRCIGFSALKGVKDLESRVEAHLGSAQGVKSWEISHDYHFGGFAKLNARLTDFISNIHQTHDLLLDPVYTGKMLFGLLEWVYQGRICQNTRILAVHTGGLQGWRGFGDKVPSFV
jgi:1-aminocyclopropane-1-carboxylate deaminase